MTKRTEEIEGALKELLGLAIMPDPPSGDAYCRWQMAVERGRQALMATEPVSTWGSWAFQYPNKVEKRK